MMIDGEIIRKSPGGSWTFRAVCPRCGKPAEVTGLRKRALDRWQAGELVQTAFPGLSPAEREILASGMHDECFNAWFPEEDEDLYASCIACSGWEEDASCTCPRICGHLNCTGPDA